MSEQKCEQESPEILIDAKVVSACSSLTRFACEFDNGKGLLLEAAETAEGPSLISKVLPANELPQDADAVCKVDWSWIYGHALRTLVTTRGASKLDLAGVGPLTVSVQTWQGKPFLAFQPFRAQS
jgi:hypothetical protein